MLKSPPSRFVLGLVLEFVKIVRDPIHGFISLTEEEVTVVDSSVFQRLRGIKQLAMTDYVFPGAVHTRFEHSLGTLHMANRILDRLAKNPVPPKVDEIRVVRLAALLHDVGHGPFSHVAENFFRFPVERDVQLGHSKASVDVVRHHPDLDFLGDARENVADLLTDWLGQRTVLRDIVSGPLDADKMDYLLRDSYYCGVRYGVTDVERIVFTLQRIDDLPERGRSFLGVSWKGREAVESLVLARYFMHNQVYLHHTRLICDAMISRAVKLAIRDGGTDPRLFEYKTEVSYLNVYLSLTDATLLEALQSSASEHSKQIVERLRLRRLFKPILETEVSTIPDPRVRSRVLELSPEDMLKYEREIADASGMESEFVILARQELTRPTYRGTPSKNILDAKTILVMGDDGIPRELEQISPIFREMGDRVPVTISCYAGVAGATGSERIEQRERIRSAAKAVVPSIGM